MAGTKHYETDIAIIGGGGAGIAAGIEARDAGARAIAFERAATPGGAAIISGGGCLIVGSPLQKQNGINDTPDLAFNDWIKWGGPSADEVWARYYIEHSLHDLYHWAEGLGAKWVDMKPQEGNSVLRWTRSEHNGLGLMTHMIDAFRERGGEIVVNADITQLKLENDRVTGIAGTDAETGDRIDVTAKAVVVASGGFNSNLDMVLEARPELKSGRVMEGSGRASSTMSRLELNPPVDTTTTLAVTSIRSPVSVFVPSMPVTRSFSSLSRVISALGTISPPRLRNASIRWVISPSPLCSERVQRITLLPSCGFMSTHFAPSPSAQKYRSCSECSM